MRGKNTTIYFFLFSLIEIYLSLSCMFGQQGQDSPKYNPFKYGQLYFSHMKRGSFSFNLTLSSNLPLSKTLFSQSKQLFFFFLIFFFSFKLIHRRPLSLSLSLSLGSNWFFNLRLLGSSTNVMLSSLFLRYFIFSSFSLG